MASAAASWITDAMVYAAAEAIAYALYPDQTVQDNPDLIDAFKGAARAGLEAGFAETPPPATAPTPAQQSAEAVGEADAATGALGGAQGVLAVPMHRRNDALAATVGGFLIELLATLWRQGSDFSSKRPLGNSDWQWQVYEALARAGVIQAQLDEDGCIDDMEDDEQRRADELIDNAIRSLFVLTDATGEAAP